MENCIFCKIINNEIPSYKIYEDDYVLAFLDISQVTKGHTLVIPKKHSNDIFEVDDDSLIKTYQVVKKLSVDLVDKLGANGVNIINNNKAAAGQTVFHFHVHIVPRYDENDNLVLKFNESANKDIEAVYNLLK